MHPDKLTELQAQRTAELHDLRIIDPVAWAICCGKRGLITISDHILYTPDRTLAALEILLAAKDIKKGSWKGKTIYEPNSRRMIRLTKRATVIKHKNKQPLELDDED